MQFAGEKLIDKILSQQQKENAMSAYSGKELLKVLESKGLNVAEDAAKVLVESVLDWVQDSAVKSENKVDDIVAGLIPALKPYVMEQLDKIDGEEG